MALRSAWAAVTLPMPFSPPPAATFAARRVVDVFVAWNSDRAGLAAQLPEIGFFTADLI
jgi:hypothetical protein